MPHNHVEGGDGKLEQGYTTCAVAELLISPVKSCAMTPLNQAIVTPTGFENDRRWMIIDSAGRNLTQRTEPSLVLIHPTLTDNLLTLDAPDMPAIEIPLDPENLKRSNYMVGIWGKVFTAHDEGDDVSDWLTRFIGKPSRLVQTPPNHHRTIPKYAGRGEDFAHLNWQDGYPFHAFLSESLAHVNAVLPNGTTVTRAVQYRPNIVFSGLPPNEEYEWEIITIGSVPFYVVKATIRCNIPNVNPETAATDEEPYGTLRKQYSTAKGPVFGVYLIPAHDGVIHLGDSVKVLTRRPSLLTIASPRPDLAIPGDKSDFIAPDDYFTAYLDGGQLLPQIRLGSNIFLLQTLLNNLPTNWTHFAQSSLSDDQITNLGNVMDVAHSKRGVRRLTSFQAVNGDIRVSNDDLQREWLKTKAGVYFSLLSFINGVSPRIDRDVSDLINLQNTAIIQTFFDPANIETIKSMMRAVNKAYSVLMSEPVSLLSRLYRLGFDQVIAEEEKSGLIGQVMSNLAKYDISSPNDNLGGIVGDTARQTIINMLNDQLDEDEPDHDWLLYGKE